MKRIIGRYYEQLYANKLDNLDEVEKLLDRNKLPKLIQEVDNQIRPVFVKLIECIFECMAKSSLQKKSRFG